MKNTMKPVKKIKKALLIGAAFLSLKFLPMVAHAEERIGQHRNPTTAGLFVREDIKERKTAGGFSLGSGTELGPLTGSFGAGVVSDGSSLDFDLVNLALLKTFLVGAETHLSPSVFVVRDLQVGIERDEGAMILLSHRWLSTGVSAEHLKGNAYPLVAIAGVKVGDFSTTVNFVTVLIPGQEEPNLGGRVFLDYVIAGGLRAGGNIFLMTGSSEGERELKALTTQLGISKDF